ncbi:PTS glucose transporter subunit IIB [Treponema phagedenis]|uniref:PTS system N-acetylmuramic acid-specific EIIBC component n=1 Tax=Treponema phagedenis TaxID=162 RepID=A0A0B7GU05_TREPH|nr:PTS transporter subunit EIIC [Treponema phagedenis]NVP25533.1 PTS transporter subunit EIIC [Treponema phagedenis]QEJ95923.1 PTS glucose transporter subunit IIB [Treponema phagedenis]QEJ97333.1 PTS glucose transporter subunit IIB [Treponema phagedenis]QEK00378.1 PTS glucose transporter subunit IIB [Treponema phagedenis]QEK02473.1 PTS glucose transporter subunit IIB [Treponema phagedenis]
MNNEELAKQIITLCGGESNLVRVTNCMTRCRLTVFDASLVEESALKSTEGVLGLISDGDSFQVVLGPGKAKKVTDVVLALTGKDSGGVTESWQENKERIKTGQKQNFLKKMIQIIANIFIPLIPAIIAAGLFNGFASLIGTLQGQGVIAGTGFWKIVQLLFSLIGAAFLGYFAIYTGINAAKVFGATEALGGMIGGLSIGANIVAISKIFGLFNEEIPLNSILTTGKGGVIGVIAGVWILSKIEKSLRKKIPDVLDLVITPFITMLITSILFVFIIMPVAGFISDGLVAALKLIIMSPNPVISVISGYVLSALFLPMVLMGLHHGLIPIYAIQLEAMGGVSLFPVLAMAGAGQVGAAIAIYVMAKKAGNERMQKVIAGALPAGFLGVGEPLIYGVTLPLFKPFITAGLGAGFGGAYVMLTHVMSSAWGPSGLVAIAIIQPQHMLNYFIGLVVSYIAGFIITKLVMKPKDLESN